MYDNLAQNLYLSEDILMENRIFFEALEKDYYVRHFDLYLSTLPDRIVHLTAHCSEPEDVRVREKYCYYLEIYFSVDDLSWAKFLVGFAFGEKKRGKQALDDEIAHWVLQEVKQPSFIEEVNHYLNVVQVN